MLVNDSSTTAMLDVDVDVDGVPLCTFNEEVGRLRILVVNGCGSMCQQSQLTLFFFSRVASFSALSIVAGGDTTKEANEWQGTII